MRWVLQSIVWFLSLLAAGFSVLAAADCPAILERAQKAFDDKQFSVAASELESALTLCPLQGQRIRLALGQTQYLLGKDAEAEQSLKAMLAADPNHEEALYALGRVYAM